ncbi:MAG: methyltransferase domain-containing protein, partial [Candidatus Omnitrophota bacterium]
MKKSLVDILICPDCKAKFNLEVFNQEIGGEVLDGVLICSKNKHWYSVISGIPRVFIGKYREVIYQRHKDYFSKYQTKISELRKPDAANVLPADFEIQLKRTAKSFGFEWNKFSDYSLDNLAELLKPHSLNSFSGKLGLDAGCGGGRHVIKSAGTATTIIGVDLSDAVEEANKKVRGLGNAHILQSDIYRLPFKNNTFDFIYSLGVLHHFPEPQVGFDKLVDLLKPDGEIFIWVYKRSLRKVILNPIRAVTSKFPVKILLYVARIFAFVGYFGIIVPSRIFIRIFPVLRKIMPAHILEYC